MTVPQRRKRCWTELQFIPQEGWELKQQGKNTTIHNVCFFPFPNLTFFEVFL